MALRNREQAARAAEAKKTNVPGTCQMVTREYYNSPSVGDVDGDGSADAEDGWKSEPASARHRDKNPPRGVPVAFRGGSNDNWHRAISLGGGVIRSTDFDGATQRYSPGKMGNGTIDAVARAMGQVYMGWTTTIGGKPIPYSKPARKPKPKPVPKGPRTRGANVDAALKRLGKAEHKAKDGTARDTRLKRAMASLRRITPWRKK